MNKPKRALALLTYLLPVLGWLYVLLFHRKDDFSVYHAKQSMIVTVVALGVPAAWAVVSWGVAWIPLAGSILAAALFALVVLAYMLLAAAWVIGVVYVLRAKMKPLPVVGRWAERIPVGKASDRIPFCLL